MALTFNSASLDLNFEIREGGQQLVLPGALTANGRIYEVVIWSEKEDVDFREITKNQGFISEIKSLALGCFESVMQQGKELILEQTRFELNETGAYSIDEAGCRSLARTRWKSSLVTPGSGWVFGFFVQDAIKKMQDSILSKKISDIYVRREA